jgi:hypothetical protein
VQLHHADIGVMAGFREDYDLGCATIWKEQSGGAFIDVDNCTFNNNYVDILFREYDGEFKTSKNEICMLDGSLHNLSTIINSNFNLPSANQHCNSIKNELLARLNQVGRCHIVDLADSSIFYNPLFPLGFGQNLRGYLGYYFGVNFLSTPSLIVPRINNNFYSNKACATLKFYK